MAVSPDGKRVAVGRLYGGVFVHELKPNNWNADVAAKLTPADLEKHWGELTTDNATLAHQLLWTFTAVNGLFLLASIAFSARSSPR